MKRGQPARHVAVAGHIDLRTSIKLLWLDKNTNLWGMILKLLMPGLFIAIVLIPTGSLSAQDGAAVYGKNCAVCHNALRPGTLKTKSVDQLVASVISGLISKHHGEMRPRAGRSLSDDDIRAAVIYMQSIAK